MYGTVFETGALDAKFARKYENILSMLSFIENIYYINREHGTLIPINCNPDPSNINKTVARKVIAYYNIIKSLNSDEYGMIIANIGKIRSRYIEHATFQIPEFDCTGKYKNQIACTHHYEAREVSPLELLFHGINWQL